MINFIGQQGPTSKWKLAALDICILALQLVMLSVSVKRRDLKKNLVKISGGGSSATERAEGAEGATSESGREDEGQATSISTGDRDQDADSEERGVLRRTDTMSDAGADAEAEDALLPSSAESGEGHADVLDILASGQGVIGNFSLIDTLLQEHNNYVVYRQTRTESATTSGLSPDTLRQLQSIRARFGVGGG
jgi:hypothetical protein